MYAETFNIATASAGIETAAKFVQWAQTGIMQGAAENDGTIRYNLDQFWKIKASMYQWGTAQVKSQLDYLDTWAHGLWAALEAGKQSSAAPAMIEQLRANLTGGTPARAAAETATQNLQIASANMQKLGIASGTVAGAGLANLAAGTLASAQSGKTESDKFWAGMMSEGPFDIPKVVWGAGAAVLLGLILMRRNQ